MLKNIIDRSVALILLLITLPLQLIVAAIVRVWLGRPVLFRQPRPGLHGKTFMLYKFRTMKDSCDSNGQLLSDRERMTSVGRFLRAASLDELPTLINVLIGDMSFVGPRPLLESYIELYTDSQARRHEVKPGITGWAQVNGRNSLSWEAKFEHDVWYVDNQSLLLDMKILMLTVVKVIAREGISAEGQVTIEKFKGSRARNGDA